MFTAVVVVLPVVGINKDVRIVALFGIIKLSNLIKKKGH